MKKNTEQFIVIVKENKINSKICDILWICNSLEDLQKEVNNLIEFNKLNKF